MDADGERGWLVPRAFCCAITHDEMVDPVITRDGHCYERAAIVEWLRRSDTSPKTNAALTSTELIPCHNLKSRHHDTQPHQDNYSLHLSWPCPALNSCSNCNSTCKVTYLI